MPINPDIQSNSDSGLHLEQLGLCPEASDHLKNLKDSLIAISNDLIDNADEMTSEKVEALRQERCIFLLFFPTFS